MRLVRPERQRLSDDRFGGNRPKIASIETVGDCRIHEKYFVCANVAAALPDWQLAAQAITFARLTNCDAVDDNFAVNATDPLPWKCCDSFEEGYAARQISALRKEAGNCFGRIDSDTITDLQMINRCDHIEAE